MLLLLNDELLQKCEIHDFFNLFVQQKRLFFKILK